LHSWFCYILTNETHVPALGPDIGPKARQSEVLAIIRRPISAPPSREGPRINDMINCSHVRLIDETGNNRGVVSTREALIAAEDAGLDLVEIAPEADPPVAKILDFGKYRFQEQKRVAEARKKQKIIEIKEIKMRPNIDDHDYETKMRFIKRFFEEGDKVKVTLRFRGRELAHQELGMNLLMKVQTDVAEIARIEQSPKMEGRQMTMVMSPK